MINAKELHEKTKLNNKKEQIELWFKASLPKIEALLLERSCIGKFYLSIGQHNLRWMSVPEFRSKVVTELEFNGYTVSKECNNSIHVRWG